MVGAIAESINVPFIQKLISGSPKHQDLSYIVTGIFLKYFFLIIKIKYNLIKDLLFIFIII